MKILKNCRTRMNEETSLEADMSIRTAPSFPGESDENIYEEICNVLQKQEYFKT